MSRSYGVRLPSSLTKVLSPTLVHSHHPTSVGLRYGRLHAPPTPFLAHRGPPRCLDRSRRSAHPLLPVSRRGHGAGTCHVQWARVGCPTGSALASPHGGGAGILTGCPSPTPCGLGLGPPNPPRMTLPEEPSGLRWADFSSALTLLMPAFALPAAPPVLPDDLRR